MKKFLLFFSFLFSWCMTAQIQWMTLEDAVQAQKVAPKKILIDFVADWCAPCRTMEKETYGHPKISSLINELYYPVKFNVESKQQITLYNRIFRGASSKERQGNMHEFAKYMNVNAVPSTVFLDENASPITIVQGALSPRELEPYLPFFADNTYLKVKTRDQWESYRSKFKPSIKK